MNIASSRASSFSLLLFVISMRRISFARLFGFAAQFIPLPLRSREASSGRRPARGIYSDRPRISTAGDGQWRDRINDAVIGNGSAPRSGLPVKVVRLFPAGNPIGGSSSGPSSNRFPRAQRAGHRLNTFGGTLESICTFDRQGILVFDPTRT